MPVDVRLASPTFHRHEKRRVPRVAMDDVHQTPVLALALPGDPPEGVLQKFFRSFFGPGLGHHGQWAHGASFLGNDK